MNSYPKVPSKETAQPAPAPKHALTLRARTHTELCGVLEVLRFDETAVELRTDCGMVRIEGREIRMQVLDVEKGLVSFDGRVDGIWYEDEPHGRTEKGFFGRLFG